MSPRATGPRSEAGKEHSSLNSLKHGLRSERPVLPGEDPAEWEAFCADAVRELEPANDVERAAAERVALQMWRMRRTALYEADIADEFDEDEPLMPLPVLDRVVRYEAHMSRQLNEALASLRQLKAERARTMPTVRLVESSPTARIDSVPESSFGKTARRESGRVVKETVEPAACASLEGLFGKTAFLEADTALPSAWHALKGREESDCLPRPSRPYRACHPTSMRSFGNRAQSGTAIPALSPIESITMMKVPFFPSPFG